MRTRPKDGLGDEGFTLVEVTVALFILTVTLLGLIGAGFTAMRAAALGRANTQAADVGNAQLEYLRSLPYAAVTHASSDTSLTTAPDVAGGAYGGEPLEVAPGGLVAPVRQVQVATGITYEIFRYVTRPAVATTTASGLPSVRRLTVLVRWNQRGVAKQKSFGTLMTSTRRGLPLPNYRFDYNGAGLKSSGRWRIVRAPGAQADFGMRISNLGARDAWEITASTSGWSYYLDTNANGTWDGSATEPAMTDSNGNGVPDTGLLEPNSPSQFIVATRTTLTSEAGTQDTDFRATSAAQPGVPPKVVPVSLAFAGTPGSSPSPMPSATADAGPSPSATAAVPCTPGSAARVGSASTAVLPPPETFTNIPLRLFNGTGTIDGDSNTQTVSTMGSSGTAAPGDCNYSLERGDGGAGRYTTSASPGRWEYGTTASTDEFRGTAAATVWVQCPTTGTKLTFSVLKKNVPNNGVPTDELQGTPTEVTVPTSCASSHFIPVRAEVFVGQPNGSSSNAAFKVAASTADRLVLKVSPSQPVRLLYEAPLSDAALVIPAK